MRGIEATCLSTSHRKMLVPERLQKNKRRLYCPPLAFLSFSIRKSTTFNISA